MRSQHTEQIYSCQHFFMIPQRRGITLPWIFFRRASPAGLREFPREILTTGYPAVS